MADAADNNAPNADLSVQGARAAIADFTDRYQLVRAEIGKAIVGHADVVDGVLTCLFTGGHALLEGVPGLGKTLLIRSLARALSLSFSRIQFTPDLMPADISGTTVVREAEGRSGTSSREFVFQPGPIFAQIVLADEINRATPKTQSALLEAMQERSVTVGRTTHDLPRPFFVMATQNPVEQEGTYPLPEAQLDRFFFKLLVGYSSRQELSTILDRTTAGGEPEINPVLTAEQILSYQALIRRAAVAPHVQDYAVRLTLATHPSTESAFYRSSRPEPRLSTGAGGLGVGTGGPGGGGGTGSAGGAMVERYVRMGASPRAAQAVLLGAKCRALLDGRAAVSIDDIRAVALPAMRHRIILNFEAEAEGLTTDAVIENILATLPVNAPDAGLPIVR